MGKKARAAPVGAMKAQKGTPKDDPFAVLGENILVMILGSLAADDCARCALVSKTWRSVAASDEIWHRHCMVRDCLDMCTRHGW